MIERIDDGKGRWVRIEVDHYGNPSVKDFGNRPEGGEGLRPFDVTVDKIINGDNPWEVIVDTPTLFVASIVKERHNHVMPVKGPLINVWVLIVSRRVIPPRVIEKWTKHAVGIHQQEQAASR